MREEVQCIKGYRREEAIKVSYKAGGIAGLENVSTKNKEQDSTEGKNE